MDNQSNQSVETNQIDSQQATADAQASQIDRQQYSGGNAMLDAQIQADSQSQPEDNTASNVRTQPTLGTKSSKQADTTGIYPSDLNELDDEGNLSVSHDNPQAD